MVKSQQLNKGICKVYKSYQNFNHYLNYPNKKKAFKAVYIIVNIQ
jgi:hypothetical protein